MNKSTIDRLIVFHQIKNECILPADVVREKFSFKKWVMLFAMVVKINTWFSDILTRDYA